MNLSTRSNQETITQRHVKAVMAKTRGCVRYAGQSSLVLQAKNFAVRSAESWIGRKHTCAVRHATSNSMLTDSIENTALKNVGMRTYQSGQIIHGNTQRKPIAALERLGI